jgi:hypothetical protein
MLMLVENLVETKLTAYEDDPWRLARLATFLSFIKGYLAAKGFHYGGKVPHEIVHAHDHKGCCFIVFKDGIFDDEKVAADWGWANADGGDGPAIFVFNEKTNSLFLVDNSDNFYTCEEVAEIMGLPS